MNRYIIILALPLFFLNCARQTSPTGGPQDTIPPSLIHSRTIPKNEQINFKGQTITLVFNEAIILNNPKEQIIVVPDIEKKYEIKVRKNSAILTFDNELKDTTTYSINFRDAIQDITEKNIPTNLKLAFSTGHYIDSLSIQGKSTTLLKNEDLKEATIALYQSDTFNIFKHKPIYLTKSDKKGVFSIENLKPGKYYLYVFEDKNRNLIVDSKNEGYGFIAKKIDLKKDTTLSTIGIIKLDIRPLKLSNSRPYNTYFNVKLNKSIKVFKLVSQETKQPIAAVLGEDQSSLKIYNTFPTADSTAVNFHAQDSADNTIDTLLYIKFSNREVKKEAFTLKPLGTKVIQEKGLLESKIAFSKPLSKIIYDSIYYSIDSTRSIQITPEDIQYDSILNILSIKKRFDKSILTPPKLVTHSMSETRKPQPMNYNLIASKKSFISIESDSSTAFLETSKPRTIESTGVIIAQTNFKEGNYIIELRDKTFNLVDSRANQSKVQFEDLLPGDYQLSLVIDTDQNGRWSPGNILRKEEPEKIIYYKNEKGTQTINLKANWELGPLLINP